MQAEPELGRAVVKPVVWFLQYEENFSPGFTQVLLSSAQVSPRFRQFGFAPGFAQGVATLPLKGPLFLSNQN